jgi:hypothetical protein
MRKAFNRFRRMNWRQRVALLGCLALLYFAAGGAFFHHHTGGSENGTPCHICQALHMPALAAAPLRVVPAAQQVGWHKVQQLYAAVSDSFDLHRASRAPPIA